MQGNRQYFDSIGVWYFRKPTDFSEQGSFEGSTTGVGTSTTLSFEDTKLPQTGASGDNNFWAGAEIRFTSGTTGLLGQKRRVNAFNASTNTLSWLSALGAAPADGSTYEIDQVSIIPSQHHHMIGYYAAALAAPKKAWIRRPSGRCSTITWACSSASIRTTSRPTSPATPRRASAAPRWSRAERRGPLVRGHHLPGVAGHSRPLPDRDRVRRAPKQLATDACREFARRTESVRGQETISFTSSFTTARLPIGVVRVMKGSMLFSTYTYRMLLDRCEERDVQAGITTTGMPTHWYVTDDLQSIGLYPKPSASGTLYLDCIMSGREYVVTPITVTPTASIDTTGGVLDLPSRPDDWYNGCKVTVTSGTYLGLTNVIKDYVSSSGQCDFEFTMPAALSNTTTLEVVDCPDVPHHFSHYLVQYVVARALQQPASQRRGRCDVSVRAGRGRVCPPDSPPHRVPHEARA